MFVVAVNHLLDVVVFVVVADVLPIADPVADGGKVPVIATAARRPLIPAAPRVILETTPLSLPLVPSLSPMSPWRSRLLR